MLMQQNVIVAMQSAVLIALCRFLEVSIHYYQYGIVYFGCKIVAVAYYYFQVK